MSKSYKKTPISKDNNKSAHKNKKLASRLTRRRMSRFVDCEASFNGGVYKKFVLQYDIHDWVSYWTEKDATNRYNRHINETVNNVRDWSKELELYPTLEDYINKYYKKSFKRK